MEFYDIVEQTPYRLTVSKPENMEDLSDLFITREELKDLVGGNPYVYGSPQLFTMKNTVVNEVKKWSDKLEASGKKTIPIDDEDLLEILKEGFLSDYTPDTDRFGRHGDRICYAKRFKRKKLKATQGDVRTMWRNIIPCAFRDKYGCYPAHVPTYKRSVTMFNAFKKIVGWKLIRKQINNKDTVKFYRQIWDNPEEFFK